MTCLRWILGYMRLEILHKIGLSGDWCLCTVLCSRSGACYYWIGHTHAHTMNVSDCRWQWSSAYDAGAVESAGRLWAEAEYQGRCVTRFLHQLFYIWLPPFHFPNPWRQIPSWWGSMGITPGKLLEFYTWFGAFWCSLVAVMCRPPDAVHL